MQDRDLRLLREIVRTKLNMEMAATEEMQRIALQVKPDITTLVPGETGGTDDRGRARGRFPRRLSSQDYIGPLQQAGIAVSLFIDPDEKQIAAARKAGADWVEIHTGSYANARTEKEPEQGISRRSPKQPRSPRASGLRVGAGHGLNYRERGNDRGHPGGRGTEHRP